MIKELKPQVGDKIIIDGYFHHEYTNSPFRGGDEFRVDAIVNTGDDNRPTLIIYATPLSACAERLNSMQVVVFKPGMDTYSHLYIGSKAAVPSILEVVHARQAVLRSLMNQCLRYYPILQKGPNGTEQVAAAATPAGAVTIKETFERRFPGERYSIGPCTPIMSDDFIALEFEPTPLERVAIQEEIKKAQAAMPGIPSPENIENILKGVPREP